MIVACLSGLVELRWKIHQSTETISRLL